MQQEILERYKGLKGTVNSDVAPWDSYESELCPEIKDPVLRAAVEEYGNRPSPTKTSTQNLEEQHRQREMSYDASREFHWLKQDDFVDEAARLIDPMHSSRFLLKLQEMGLRCWYGSMLFRGLIFLYVQREWSEPEYATSVQCGYMPAFSLPRFDANGVPLDYKYKGYWQVLTELIMKGFITEKQAVDAFGVPRGPAGLRTRKMLYEFRNRGN